jgi:hypothetical protein
MAAQFWVPENVLSRFSPLFREVKDRAQLSGKSRHSEKTPADRQPRHRELAARKWSETGLRRDGLGHLVHVARRRQARADVEELPDPRRATQ